jgi:hypothetical protein
LRDAYYFLLIAKVIIPRRTELKKVMHFSQHSSYLGGKEMQQEVFVKCCQCCEGLDSIKLKQR